MDQERKIKKALEHTFNEVGLQNMEKSIRKSKFDVLQKSHDSIHQFVYLASCCTPAGRKVSWHSKSAFLTYQWEVFQSAHRSFLEATAGYYNAAYTLLRNTLELLLKGAFWECLAHKQFRENAQIIKKKKVRIGDEQRSILDWFEDIFRLKPSIKDGFEKNSASIYDKISPLTKEPELKNLIPPLKLIVKQLSHWQVFEPIPNPTERIYGIYGSLSADVHVIPDKTDLGRRLMEGADLFEVTVIPRELNKFSHLLHTVMDTSVVVELSILGDWVQQDGGVKQKLKERLYVLEKDLQLPYASIKIRELLEV